jgi:hypothetical protein
MQTMVHSAGPYVKAVAPRSIDSYFMLYFSQRG